MVVFHLPGGIPVYAFSLLISLGVFIGMVWVVWQSPEKEAPRRMEAGIWALCGALVGGRVVFVASNWPYFQSRPWESLQVYLGGLSWPGAFAGSLVALALYASFSHHLLTELADALVPLLTCLSVSAWLGCWLDGCAYGVATSTWLGVPTPDEWGQVSNRYPVQLIGALFTVGLFWSSERAVRRGNFKLGTLACLGLLNLSLITFGLSFLRVDLAPICCRLRLEAWAALIFAGLAVVALFTIYGRRKEIV